MIPGWAIGVIDIALRAAGMMGPCINWGGDAVRVRCSRVYAAVTCRCVVLCDRARCALAVRDAVRLTSRLYTALCRGPWRPLIRALRDAVR